MKKTDNRMDSVEIWIDGELTETMKITRPSQLWRAMEKLPNNSTVICKWTNGKQKTFKVSLRRSFKMNEKRQQDIKWLESAGFTVGNNDERFATFYKAVDIFNGSGIKLIFYVQFLDERYFVEFQIVRGEDELKDWLEAPDVIPYVYVEMADDCSIEQLIGEAEDLAIEKLTESVLNVKKSKENNK